MNNYPHQDDDKWPVKNCKGCAYELISRELTTKHTCHGEISQEKTNYRKVLEAMDTPLDSELELLDNLCDEMKAKGRKEREAEIVELIDKMSGDAADCKNIRVVPTEMLLQAIQK